jgi:hypothetical protein
VGCLAEVELVQRLDAWQARVFDASVDRAPLAILQLSREQCFQVAAEVRLTLAFGLLGQRAALAGNGRQAEQHALLLDHALAHAGCILRPRAHRAPPLTSRSS